VLENESTFPPVEGEYFPYEAHDGKGDLLDELPRTRDLLWLVRDTQMPGIEKAVLVALVLRSSPQAGWYCWPSIARLVADSGFGRTSVKQALSGLRAKGLVSWVSQRAEQKPNVYHIHVERL
jgi:hypothetical protein